MAEIAMANMSVMARRSGKEWRRGMWADQEANTAVEIRPLAIRVATNPMTRTAAITKVRMATVLFAFLIFQTVLSFNTTTRYPGFHSRTLKPLPLSYV